MLTFLNENCLNLVQNLFLIKKLLLFRQQQQTEENMNNLDFTGARKL